MVCHHLFHMKFVFFFFFSSSLLFSLSLYSFPQTMARPSVERVSTQVSDTNFHKSNQSIGSQPLDFSSPYTVHTLDNIPTPVLKLLVSLGPSLQYASQLVEIIMWRSAQPRQSVLLVLIWIVSCLWTWPLLAFGFPFLIVYKLGRDWLLLKTSRQRRETMERVREAERLKREEKLRQNRYHDEEDDDEVAQRLQQQKEEEDELISRKIRPEGEVSLDDTLKHIAIVNTFIDAIALQIQSVATQVDGTRQDAAIAVLSVMMYAWPIWIVLTRLMGTPMVFAVVGTILLISPSPWFRIVVLALRKNIILKHLLSASWAYGVALITSIIHCFTSKQTTSSKKGIKHWFITLFYRAKAEKAKALNVLETKETIQDTKGTRSEMVFQFEVFENQRWWLGVNWTTNMMPSERTPWTDNQLKPIPSKEEFDLPETSVKTTTHNLDDKVVKRTTTKIWSWADGDWWVDMTGEMQGKIDHNGWEYGNNAWKQLTGMPGIQTFTRRRRWCRRARLVEREVEEIEEKKSV